MKKALEDFRNNGGEVGMRNKATSSFSDSDAIFHIQSKTMLNTTEGQVDKEADTDTDWNVTQRKTASTIEIAAEVPDASSSKGGGSEKLEKTS